ncbi:MAG: Na+/H+ antiporter subunit E [Planctomycetes bacterium]|nr:Na+/H+ antiporter subunit E [Planctomycetota bacterium]
MRTAAAALLCWIAWIASTGALDPVGLAAGAAASAAAALALRREGAEAGLVLLHPVRLFWALVYLPVLLAFIVRSNLDVARRVIDPRLPIRPGIAKARTTLRSLPARAALANSVTLTPGTMSVDLVGDVLYVHRIWVPEEDPDGATRRELEPFEGLLRRIFE